MLFVAGLALAVWARIYLGRNWGMPMSERAEPELVTSGPYRFVRHPIYSGILLAVLGSALCTTLFWLAALVLLGAYFIYSARVEERTDDQLVPVAVPELQGEDEDADPVRALTAVTHTARRGSTGMTRRPTGR